jgi:hypothetical protein
MTFVIVVAVPVEQVAIGPPTAPEAPAVAPPLPDIPAAPGCEGPGLEAGPWDPQPRRIAARINFSVGIRGARAVAIVSSLRSKSSPAYPPAPADSFIATDRISCLGRRDPAQRHGKFPKLQRNTPTSHERVPSPLSHKGRGWGLLEARQGSGVSSSGGRAPLSISFTPVRAPLGLDRIVDGEAPRYSASCPFALASFLSSGRTQFETSEVLCAHKFSANALPIGGDFDGPCRTQMDYPNRQIIMYLQPYTCITQRSH